MLGPVEARRTDHQLEVGHAKQRAVLAVLVLELNQVVPVERLIDRVWGDDPPASVRNVLYGYVAKLKSALACAGEPGAALVRRSGGYVLQASEDTVDLCRFRRLVDDAGLADDEHAASLLRDALGLWHGEALAGLASPWLDAMRQTLEVQRVAAQLDLNDIALRQGQHQTLLSELAEQATTHPADERLTGQLMLALYRCGRQAEA
ncbi:MAG TPA: AfsR/SARP family transcriptional regulator, partial [Streptosporangiaceae bacterium]|nr:AfsR/SARP family transcriptional regulator [Streptosporangiaceae bacterium]